MNEKHNERILEAIRNNDRRVLQEFYNKNRVSFVPWCIKSYQMPEEEAIEVYQQAYMVLYNNVQRGKLQELKSQPFTYLCSVGRNIMMQRSRQGAKFQYTNMSVEEIEGYNQDEVIMDAANDLEAQERNKALVRLLLSKIGEPCAEILTMLFVQGKHPEAVAVAMNYSDERVVRKRKSLCLKRMREMVQEEANLDSSLDYDLE